MQLSARDLAKLVNGSVEGDPDVLIDRPSRIEEGGAGSVSFLGNEKYEEYAYTTTASALLVSREFTPRRPIQATLIRVDNVYVAVAQLLERFGQVADTPREIAPSAVVDPGARIGSQVGIGACSVVEAGVEIGDGCLISPQVYLGRDVRLGKNVRIYPGARILQGCIVGNNCVIHANAVIGSDGFGFARDAQGQYQKIPQTGNVVLEDDVEIGAGATIDRASIGSTTIRQGAKLDNLVQIAHNVEIGRHTVIAAQAGIAGSTRIGAEVQIGGQAGFAGHLHIADGVRVQAQSGVASSVEQPGLSLFGYPAIGYNDYLRSYVIFKKLPDLYKRLQELENLLRDKEQQH